MTMPGGSGAIAVVGAGLRYPGAVRSLDGLGELLLSDRDVFQTVPAERWGEAVWDPQGVRPGSVVNHVGGFLTDIDRFDAGFFGVSPKEAGYLDPQQRLLLEVAWEAMTNAGIPREQWKGASCSVHIGMLAGDYGLLHARTLGLTGIGPHYVTGTDPSFAAGRLAYVFDLRGPVTTINAACSSSLVAIHQACQALRAGESDVALAGGASLLIGPDLSVFLSTVGALSPTGRCRPFDAAADGMVRGEGCGVVVLKRLADARADGDLVLAVIRGSAMTHDGASLGLTAPNPASQAAMLRSALAAAGLDPAEVDYVEAHGTGTQLGDQIELGMLADVYGPGRTTPLLIGSVKAVLGHTDAAAGITGLLKAIWVAGTGQVPAQHGFEVPSPAVDWSAGLAVPTEAVPLPTPGRPARAGVSSFGLSGTNVHVILEAAPPAPPVPERAGPYVLAASSSHRATLGDQVRQLRELVERAGGDLPDLANSSLTRSTVLPYRYAVVAGDRDGLIEGLADPLDPPDGAFPGHVPNPDTPPELVFVYSGQGGQWRGMAMDLYATDEDFRACLDACDDLIRAATGWSLLAVLRGPDEDLDRTDLVQPALFAVQVAITRWLARRGVTPTAVVGHSMGEVAASHTAGSLSLHDAVKLIVERARLLHTTAGTGVMYAVKAGREATERVLAGTNGAVTVAAVNGPASVIIAGAPEPTAAAVAAFEDGGVRCRRLRVDTASHSPIVSACGPLLSAALDGLEPSSPRVLQLSTVDGHGDDALFNSEYWGRNLTRAVDFWPAVDRFLAEHDRVVFVEIGPHPVLATSVMEAVTHRGADSATIATLRRDADGPLMLHRTLAELFVNGVEVDWPDTVGRPVQFRTLPVPSWAGDRYWLPDPVEPVAEAARPAFSRAATAPPERAERAPAGTATAGAVEAIVREVLGIGEDKPLLRKRGLFEQGLDSLGAAELRRRLQDAFGLPLDVPVVFEHPTIAALAAHLADTPGHARPGDPHHVPAQRTADEAIAIVGLACRLPGADSPAAFWELLENGRSHVGEPPAGRHDDPIWRESPVPVPTRGCYLDDVAGFDAQFFRISPREARSIDPQQRLILEVAWDALEDSGHPARSLQGESVGVYVGLEAADYQQLLARNMKNVNLYYGTGSSFAAVAGRLSYFLGLTGPSLVVDTACSASLTAVHLACQGLRSGDCDTAVVGGAHVMLAPTLMVAMAESGALAADGYCKTFDEDADGYGCGEGAAVVVLKRLSDAERDHDRVYAVLRGTAINQDGASGGFTVPNGSAQTALVREALRRAGWAPDDVDYVEAHGTGTPLGDPIEVNALAAAYGQGREPEFPLLVGSTKPNVGHLAAAAGVVGLLKVTLSLWHGRIPPHRVGRPTSRIDWDNLPVELPAEARSWPGRSRPSRAAVSSFGLTGTNVHVLLEQAEKAIRPPEPVRTPVRVLPLSAASDAALRTAAKQLAAQLRAEPEQLDAIVATALFRRSGLPVRLAVTATTAAEMVAGLERAAAGRPDHLGRFESEEPAVVRFRYDGELPALEDRRRLSDAPAYREALDECAGRLERLTGVPHDLLGEVPPGWQPVYLLCHHVAVTALWGGYGVVAHSVCGAVPAVAWARGAGTFEETVANLRERPDEPDEPVLAGEEGTPPMLVDLVTSSGADPLAEIAATVAGLFVRGCQPTPASGSLGVPVSLPGYPWQHQQFWYRETARNRPAHEVVHNGGAAPDRQMQRLGRLVQKQWTQRPDTNATSI